MYKKINAYCKVCGKGYHMCLHCTPYARLHPWQMDTDSSEHFKIFQILKGHTIGTYNDKEAYERLMNVDLSDIDSFNQDIKDHLNVIFVANKKEENESLIEKESEKTVKRVNNNKRKKREDLNSQGE